MELQFNKEVCSCLRRLVDRSLAQEQTQEFRLPDGMPDIGRVLGAWGQVLIRSKEWRSGEMTISGGVQAWALYQPEDGSEPRSIESWIPFQTKWEIPDAQRDGAVQVWPLLSGMDARCVSARKLLLRCGISVHGQALEPGTAEYYVPTQVPEDVQMQTESYPVVLPKEAGEKAFVVQEELGLDGVVKQIIHYEVTPQLSEQRILANRLVFRGGILLHLLYMNGDNQICTWDTQLAFSQFSDLDSDFGDQAFANIRLITTAAELEREEDGRWHIKCGIAAQYTVYERIIMDIVSDVYSLRRPVKMQKQELRIPAKLEDQTEGMTIHADWSGEYKDLLDAVWFCEHPQINKSGDRVQFKIPGHFQILYRDGDGEVQGAVVKSESNWETDSDRENLLQLYWQKEALSTELGAGQIGLRQAVRMQMEVFADGSLSAVSALEFGEEQEPDTDRPSVILKRAGGSQLWDVAKACGSTVEAIRSANDLDDDPEADRLLLIPVI